MTEQEMKHIKMREHFGFEKTESPQVKRVSTEFVYKAQHVDILLHV